MECSRLLFDHLAWIEHRFLSGIRDSRKAGSLWGMMRGVGGVRKSEHQSWLAKVLGLGLLCWGFKGRHSKSTHKLLMIPFFDSTGMIYMHWVPTGQTVNKEYYVEVLREFRKRFRRKMPTLFKSAQWHFHQDNAPVHYSILVTDYLTKMGIKTSPYRPYSPDLAPCDFWLFPKVRGCRYETIEKMKETVTEVIDTLTQEVFYGAFQKMLKRYNKCIAAGGDYFEGDKNFMCVLSIKVPIVWKPI